MSIEKVSYDNLALVANGLITDLTATASLLRTFQTIIAVDGGLHHCDQMGIIPHALTGDFDSIPQNLLKKYLHIPQWCFPNQYKTDLEKTLEYLLPLTSGTITVFGALGKRTDHTLVNINLLTRYPKKVIFESETEKLYVLNKEEELFFKKGQTLSLIPLNGPVLNVTTQGLQWDLQQGHFDKYFMGISNVVIEQKVKIIYEKGDLLLCENRLLA